MKGAPAVPRGPLTSMPTWSNTSKCFTTSAFFSQMPAAVTFTAAAFAGSLTIERGHVMGIVLLIILVLLLVGGLPSWGYSQSWGYGPSGVLGLVLVIVLVLVLMGHIPSSF
jgi:Protein of unknown function (DUF3309)